MITHVRFQNFKALKNAELKLGAFNVIIGPNGSGKSTVLQGLEAMANPNPVKWPQMVTAGMPLSSVSITFSLNFQDRTKKLRLEINPQGQPSRFNLAEGEEQSVIAYQDQQDTLSYVGRIRTFSFQTSLMPIPVDPRHYGLLNPDGSNLAEAITFLRDKDEDAYNLLRAEMQRWIPEYDSIGFETDQNNYRRLALRQKNSRQIIPDDSPLANVMSFYLYADM